MWICQLTWHFPILLDAATAAVSRKGDKFLARWADIMTGRLIIIIIIIIVPQYILIYVNIPLLSFSFLHYLIISLFC